MMTLQRTSPLLRSKSIWLNVFRKHPSSNNFNLTVEIKRLAWFILRFFLHCLLVCLFVCSHDAIPSILNFFPPNYNPANCFLHKKQIQIYFWWTKHLIYHNCFYLTIKYWRQSEEMSSKSKVLHRNALENTNNNSSRINLNIIKINKID